MFEKFAEEYANNARTQKENEVIVTVDDWGVESLSPDERRLWQGISDRQNARKEGFLKGAEFVYNKMNDWHKQDIDDIYDLISKDWEDKYFICIMKDKSRITAIGNCYEGNNGEVSVNLLFEYDDEKYYLDDIVWWKEIILPKEGE